METANAEIVLYGTVVDGKIAVGLPEHVHEGDRVRVLVPANGNRFGDDEDHEEGEDRAFRSAVSARALAEIWDNPEDDAFAERYTR